jgi:hypothetical protein
LVQCHHEPPDTALLDPELDAGGDDDCSDPELVLEVELDGDVDEDLAAEPEVELELALPAADFVPVPAELPDVAWLASDDRACVEPGSARAIAPPASTPATPTLAVVLRSRLLARSRAATARRTSLCRALIRHSPS